MLIWILVTHAFSSTVNSAVGLTVNSAISISPTANSAIAYTNHIQLESTSYYTTLYVRIPPLSVQVCDQTGWVRSCFKQTSFVFYSLPMVVRE